MSGWRKSSRSMSNGNCVAVSSWRKSSRSAGVGQCVEIGTDWRKSSLSSYNSNCVEAGNSPCGVLVRDTADRGGLFLAFTAVAWAQFLARAAGGTR